MSDTETPTYNTWCVLYKNNKTFNKREILELINRTLKPDEKIKIFVPDEK